MSNAIVIFFVVFSSTNGVKDRVADSLPACGLLLYEVSVSTSMKLSWQIIYLFDIMLTLSLTFRLMTPFYRNFLLSLRITMAWSLVASI